MAPKYLSLLFALASILVIEASTLGGKTTTLGGWKPIPNLKDPQVVKVANFAVAEHNKEAKTTLEFVTIVKGEQQVVAGLKYRLVISAKGAAAAAAAPKSYNAEVVSQPWKKLLELLSFEETRN
ncbi:hypothetical protein ACP275_13G133500 [Erythranthe tilingii]